MRVFCDSQNENRKPKQTYRGTYSQNRQDNNGQVKKECKKSENMMFLKDFTL